MQKQGQSSQQFQNSTQHQQTEQSEQKSQKRHRLLKNLFRNHRQANSDRQFEQLVASDEQLFTGYNHNKFGAFCLQAGQLDKALQHLNKAKQIIGKRFVYSNVEMNLGNLQAQRKNYQQAIQHYQRQINGPNTFSSKLNSFTAYVDAHTNIAVMYVQLNQFEKGFEYCKKSLQLKPQQSQAMVNFTDIMRQLGKKQQAISYTWSQIVDYTKKKANPDYQKFKAIEIEQWTPSKQQYNKQKKINVLCVKWGTRYSPDYVNKLYAGIKRNTSWDITFYCFTDDGAGLNQNIKVQMLQKGWQKWWGKVSLFNCKIQGKKFYIDLDMVITGNLDLLFQYKGQFATLRSGDLQCQKNHKQGYNSSVMIWQGNFLSPVYQALKQNFEVINKFIVRFDFWLQMTINNANYIQKLYPGKVIDYLGDAQKQLPVNSAVVCFARKPKPQDYPAEWIREHWIL